MAGSDRYKRQTEPELVAKDEVNLGATGFTTDTFSVAGYNQIAIMVEHTWVNASTVYFYLDHSEDGGTTWHTIQAMSVSAGIGTLTDLRLSKAVTADDQWTVNFGVNYDLMRLRFDGAGSTTDTDTVYILKSAN